MCPMSSSFDEFIKLRRHQTRIFTSGKAETQKQCTKYYFYDILNY